MIVIQQVNVLPKGAEIYIFDNDKIVTSCKKSIEDGSLLFDSIESSEHYYKIYSTFKVYELSVQVHNFKVLSLDPCALEGQKLIYCIQIRGKSDEG